MTQLRFVLKRMGGEAVETEFDVVILGSGPAGLQAAVHAARTRARVAVLGKVQSSALFRAHVENYCCINETVTGEAILGQGREQAQKFGAVLIEEDVIHLDSDVSGRFGVRLESGDSLLTWTMIRHGSFPQPAERAG